MWHVSMKRYIKNLLEVLLVVLITIVAEAIVGQFANIAFNAGVSIGLGDVMVAFVVGFGFELNGRRKKMP